MSETFITQALTWVTTYLVHSSVALAAAWLVTRFLAQPQQRLVTWRLAMVGGVVTTTIAMALDAGPTWLVSGSTITTIALISTVAWLAIGGALFTARVIRSRQLVARLRREGLPAEASFPAVVDRLSRAGGLSQLVQLSVSENLAAPVVLGQREVCFPRRLVEQLNDDQLEAVVAHELAHVHRRDRLWLWITSGLETLCFPQVMNRVAGRLVAEDTELVCDDWAAQRTGQRRALAEGLAIVASWMTSASAANTPQPALGSERSPLLQRVERLLSAAPAPSRARGHVALLAVLLVAMACAGPVVRVSSPGTRAAEAMSIDALITAIEDASAVLGTRLLPLPAGYEAEHANLLSLPNTGAGRLFERFTYMLHPKRGGGAYYSFVTRDNDYNRAPTVSLEQGQLDAGFYGRSLGLVVDIGNVDLITLTTETLVTAVPDNKTSIAATMLTPVASEDDFDDVDKRLREYWQSPDHDTTARVDQTYLVRTRSTGEHDVLAAMHVTDVNADGIVFVWRVLKQWPLERDRDERSEKTFNTSNAPQWMFDVTMTELDAWQDDARATLTARLMDAPGFNEVRMLRRWDYSHVLAETDFLAYYDFDERAHGYDGQSDLQYEGDSLSPQGDGGILDVGAVPLEDIDTTSPPAHLDDLDRRTFRALVEIPTPATIIVPWYDESAFNAVYRERRKARRADLSDTDVVLGHTYLLRSIDREGDTLVAFTVTEENDHGITIEWRDLRP